MQLGKPWTLSAPARFNGLCDSHFRGLYRLQSNLILQEEPPDPEKVYEGGTGPCRSETLQGTHKALAANPQQQTQKIKGEMVRQTEKEKEYLRQGSDQN